MNGSAADSRCPMCGQPGTAGSRCAHCPCAYPIPERDGTTRSRPEHILQFFAHAHLPAPLAAVSRPFCELAESIVGTLPRNPERTVALRKLLEAKDAAVRALVAREDAS